MQGEISRLTDRGFGFIAAQDGLTYFFHRRFFVEPIRWDELSEGQAVEFVPAEDDQKRREATAITLT